MILVVSLVAIVDVMDVLLPVVAHLVAVADPHLPGAAEVVILLEARTTAVTESMSTEAEMIVRAVQKIGKIHPVLLRLRTLT